MPRNSGGVAMSETRRSAIASSAAHYIDTGWRCIPVMPRDKKPSSAGGWQNLRLTLEQLMPLLSEESNLGVLLGGASNGLVDVDLDCVEATILADLFLPTTWVFGRPSKLRSHWLYTAVGLKTEKFQFIDESVDAPAMVLELRSTGGQTVFPPSIHATGEQISWADDSDATDAPLVIDVESLRLRVAKLACGALIMRYAGEPAARAWAAGARPPTLPLDVMECIRKWLRVTPPTPTALPQRSGSTDVVTRARQYLARIPAAISGSGGHSQTLLAAEHLVRGFGLSDEQALTLLEEDYNPRCEPAWTTRELQHKVKEAREHGIAVESGKHLREAANAR